MAKSWTQQLVSSLVPRSWASAMEAESREWMVRCRSCGFERSMWELGGIRWKEGDQVDLGPLPQLRQAWLAEGLPPRLN